jgi:predicted NUDIX family NTP pyrophosphohydrolase
MVWPPSSGCTSSFPEVDRALFLSLEQAREKLVPAQVALLEELRRKIAPTE